MHKFSFASVNMRRHNAAMHVLLNDNGEEDVLFMQEPWFNPVGTVCCDMMYQGKDVLGGVAHPKWRLAYPSFTNSQRAKVMTYVRIHDRTLIFRKNHCQMIVRNDLASHPCILISDFHVGTYYWHILNFYNDVADPSALDTLVGLDLDATIPTLVIGDFNLHSTSWSPTGWATSSGAHRLEEWMATQTFTLLNKPRIPTHMGEGGHATAPSTSPGATWRRSCREPSLEPRSTLEALWGRTTPLSASSHPLPPTLPGPQRTKPTGSIRT
jgi:hypothetical protein